MTLEIRFRRSSSPAHGRAVALAQRSPTYRLDDGEHVATFGAGREELSTALELWSVVRTWTSATLVLDGATVAPHDRYRLLEILHCAARAVTFEDPHRYCAAPTMPQDDTRPRLPCRYWVSRWNYLLDGIDWTAPTRLDVVWALMLEFAVAGCPFMDRPRLEGAINAWRPLAPTPIPDAPVDVDQLLRRLLP